MARIKSYSNDTSLSNDDRLFGTGGTGGLNATNNFTLGDLKEFIAQGVDVVKTTPKLNVPVINPDSDDVQASTIRVVSAPSALDVEYYNQDPGTPFDETLISRQINLGQFVLFNAGDGWYLEIKEYRGKFDINSFAGKKLTAVAGPMDTTVSFTVGTDLVETDDKTYVVDSDGDVIQSYPITRTGNLELTWALLVSSRTAATELKVVAGDNSGESLNLLTIEIDGAVELGEVFIEALTAETVSFNGEGDGLTFQLPGSNDYNTMTMDADGNLVIEGFGDGSMIVNTPSEFQQNISVTGNEANGEANLTFTSTDPQDDQSVIIDRTGITYTNDFSESAEILPVIANDSVAYEGTEGVVVDQGTLTQIQIGNDYWNVPSSLSQVAQILPGLSENLTPVPDTAIAQVIHETNIGRFKNIDISNLRATPTTYEAFLAETGGWAAYAGNPPSTFITFSDLTGGIFAEDITDIDAITDAAAPVPPVITSAQQDNITNFIAVTGGDLPDIDWGSVVGNANHVIRIYNNNDVATDFIDMAINGSNHHAVTISDVDYVFHFLNVNTVTPGGVRFDFNDTAPDPLEYDAEVFAEAELGNITTGTYFYGIDHGTFVEYKSTIAAQPAAEFLLEGSVNKEIVPDTNLQSAFVGLPTGERLFFIPFGSNGLDGITDGDTVSGQVYEVVSYIHGYDAGPPVMALLTWSLIGGGNLIISTPQLTIRNLPDAAPTTEEFLVINSDNEVEKRTLAEVAGGIGSQANYENSEDDADTGLVSSIEFESGPNNHNVATGGGAMVIDVSGRIPFNIGGVISAATNLTVWTSYMLDLITVPTQVELPPTALLQAGDTVRIINLSQIDADGEPIASDLWEVIPASGDRIMKLPADEEVILNVPATNEYVWSGSASIGWIIQ